MTEKNDLLSLVDDTLGLLTSFQPAIEHQAVSGEALESLFSQCQSWAVQIETAPPQPLHLIHHFACTGGTLISRALACQPNTMVLSEVDPFSQWFRPPGLFAPSDLVFLARQDREPPDDQVIANMFSVQMKALHGTMARQGRNVVVRDHTHSHFCAPADPTTRPLISDVLSTSFDLREIITVRHPLDSYISLHLMNSASAPVDHLEGYAARYLMFLNSYPAISVFYYEDFAMDPDCELQRMTEALELPYSTRWQDILPAIRMSGDSGRAGRLVKLRPRRSLPENIKADLAQDTPFYTALCARLGYDPDPTGSSLPNV